MKTNIKSGVIDNISRLNAINALIEAQYGETKGKSIRDKVKNKSKVDKSEENDVFFMHEESVLIGLLISWAVITLESLVNHSLACLIRNKIISTLAIENPRKIFEGRNKKQDLKSELSFKILLLGDDDDESNEIAALADNLVQIRNQIIHDKPYFVKNIESKIKEIEYFSFKNIIINELYVEDLYEVFEKLDKIKSYISTKATSKANLGLGEFKFVDLHKY